MKTFRKVLLIACFIILFLVVTVIILYHSLISPVSRSNEEKEVVIASGTSSREIGKILKENNLIKNKDFFVFYLKINKVNDLKAGKYKLKENMSLKEIVKVIREGNILNEEEISITFKEGINYREIAKVIENNTNNTYDDVLKQVEDTEYLDSLIEDYWFITDDIKNKDIYYPLEGYLFPDTYKYKNKDVTVSEIFKKMLDQMEIVLEPYKELIERDKMNVHELLTLASIAEKEVSLAKDRSKVVSVFLNRIEKGISLGSDITARYGIKLDDTRPMTTSEYNDSNHYNTRRTDFIGLPVGPIATISKDSLEAAIKPEKTNYLYFISNINTKETFFFEKSSDFEAKKKELASVNGGY